MQSALLAYAKSKGGKIGRKARRKLGRIWDHEGGDKDGGLDLKEFHKFANIVSYEFGIGC